MSESRSRASGRNPSSTFSITMERFKVYLAGPMAQLKWEQIVQKRQRFADAVRRASDRTVDFIPVDPHRYVEPQDKDSYDWASDPRILTSRDYAMIERSDVVVFDFEVPVPASEESIGMTYELAWCWALRKPSIVVLPESSSYNPVDNPPEDVLKTSLSRILRHPMTIATVTAVTDFSSLSATLRRIV